MYIHSEMISRIIRLTRLTLNHGLRLHKKYVPLHHCFAMSQNTTKS